MVLKYLHLQLQNLSPECYSKKLHLQFQTLFLKCDSYELKLQTPFPTPFPNVTQTHYICLRGSCVLIINITPSGLRQPLLPQPFLSEQFATSIRPKEAIADRSGRKCSKQCLSNLSVFPLFKGGGAGRFQALEKATKPSGAPKTSGCDHGMDDQHLNHEIDDE